MSGSSDGEGEGAPAGALPYARIWNVSDSRRAQSVAFGH